MSSHPGSTVRDAVELALFLRKNHMRPEQVQDFYPTPGTISTCMFYTGIDPLTMREVYVPRTEAEKRVQRALLQYFKPENRRLVLEALRSIKREDLIGTGPDCLVPPDAAYLREKARAGQKPAVKNAIGRKKRSGRPFSKPNAKGRRGTAKGGSR